jgi:beta-galactosidase
VKLFLNGKEIGSQDLNESNALKAEFTVPYGPGDLKAIVYEGSTETGSITFTTAGKAHKLILTPERPRLNTGGDDVGYVMLSVVDEAGRPVPDAVVPVTFSVDGAAEIMGVGNANPKDVASFQQPHRDTFHGACLLVVRPRGEPGKIVIRAESAGLLPATTELEAASS